MTDNHNAEALYNDAQTLELVTLYGEIYREINREVKISSLIRHQLSESDWEKLTVQFNDNTRLNATPTDLFERWNYLKEDYLDAFDHLQSIGGGRFEGINREMDKILRDDPATESPIIICSIEGISVPDHSMDTEVVTGVGCATKDRYVLPRKQQVESDDECGI